MSNSQTDICFRIPWYAHPHIHTGTCSRWCGTTGQCRCKPPVEDLTVSGGWWCGGPGRSPGWWGDKAETYRLRFCLSVHLLRPANGFLCFHSEMKIRGLKKYQQKTLYLQQHIKVATLVILFAMYLYSLYRFSVYKSFC